jgi:hypothetical protein
VSKTFLYYEINLEIFYISKKNEILFFLELTSACKRINKEGCYEFDKKSAKFDALV